MVPWKLVSFFLVKHWPNPTSPKTSVPTAKTMSATRRLCGQIRMTQVRQHHSPTTPLPTCYYLVWQNPVVHGHLELGSDRPSLLLPLVLLLLVLVRPLLLPQQHLPLLLPLLLQRHLFVVLHFSRKGDIFLSLSYLFDIIRCLFFFFSILILRVCFFLMHFSRIFGGGDVSPFFFFRLGRRHHQRH